MSLTPFDCACSFRIGNTAGTLGGFVSVAACGGIQEASQSWSLVLVVIAAHYLAGAVVWCSWVGDSDVASVAEGKGATDEL